ncbi:hypothetical protein GJA_4023 [Janthinobacterium agaricidamnosum NBRC 102515 = DSM 9628]|uniref:Uncharacterized protein n=1 Tax=Janthinobacterium agaricidamnosum NBRC 102515 = DSM 9628 TaxID=1349767 RepID=W0VB97_9BURK|nr:hypothetical protein GJA_4023 [Janthinobacterium agaricidamnosum NBRC 102515 = DSM 9628]
MAPLCLVCTAAGAESPPQAPPQEMPVCALDPADSGKLLAEPCRPAPPLRPRRSVSQVIGRMPAQTLPPVYGERGPASPAFTIPQPGVPAAPVPANSCDLGGCNGVNGVRYNGSGNLMFDPNGHICHRNGAFVQCF